MRFFALKSKKEKLLDRGQNGFYCEDNNNIIILIKQQYIPLQLPNASFQDWSLSTFGGDSEMELFDLWTKIRRRFKCIPWLEDCHDLGDLFKGHLGGCRSTWL